MSLISPINITDVYGARPVGIHGLNSLFSKQVIRLTLDRTARNDLALYRKLNPVSLLESVFSPPYETRRTQGPKITVTIIKALAKSFKVTMMPTELSLFLCHFCCLVV